MVACSAMRRVAVVLALLLALVGHGADATYIKVKQNNAKCFIEVIAANQVDSPTAIPPTNTTLFESSSLSSRGEPATPHESLVQVTSSLGHPDAPRAARVFRICDRRRPSFCSRSKRADGHHSSDPLCRCT